MKTKFRAIGDMGTYHLVFDTENLNVQRVAGTFPVTDEILVLASPYLNLAETEDPEDGSGLRFHDAVNGDWSVEYVRGSSPNGHGSNRISLIHLHQGNSPKLAKLLAENFDDRDILNNHVRFPNKWHFHHRELHIEDKGGGAVICASDLYNFALLSNVEGSGKFTKWFEKRNQLREKKTHNSFGDIFDKRFACFPTYSETLDWPVFYHTDAESRVDGILVFGAFLFQEGWDPDNSVLDWEEVYSGD